MIKTISKLIHSFKKKRIGTSIEVGDVFEADAFDSLAGKPMEQIWYGLRHIGGEPRYAPLYGPGSVRMKIRSASMPYYIIECEVVAYDVNDINKKEWFKRKQPRRIMKDTFHEMILYGDIKKYEIR